VSIDETRHATVNGYPNPATNSIEFALGEAQVTTVEVYNNLGQSMPVTYSSDNGIMVLDIRDLNSGLYIVNIRMDNDMVYTSRFQVLK
jgi:hypothetical protein